MDTLLDAVPWWVAAVLLAALVVFGRRLPSWAAPLVAAARAGALRRLLPRIRLPPSRWAPGEVPAGSPAADERAEKGEPAGVEVQAEGQPGGPPAPDRSEDGGG